MPADASEPSHEAQRKSLEADPAGDGTVTGEYSSPDPGEKPDGKADEKADEKAADKIGGRKGLRHMLWLAARALLIGLACMWALLYFMQERVIFPRHFAPVPSPNPMFPATQVLERKLEDGGRVVAWFVPPANAEPGKRMPAVLFCHGNAEIIDYQRSIVFGYNAMGVAVLLVEYRGYGHSDGTPSQEAIRGDAEHFYDMLVARDDVDPQRVFFHGRSIGGAVVADLARSRNPQAIITESAFSSLVSMAHRRFAPGFLVKFPYRTDHALRESDFPWLLFHGTDDEVIPVAEGRYLRELGKKHGRDVTFIEWAGSHNVFPPDDKVDAFWDEIKGFLKKHNLIDE